MNIVLLNPEIHVNTGNIGRTCVLTNTKLHLIKPLGFELGDKKIKRAKNKKDKIRDNLLEHTKYCLFSYCKDSYLWILLYLFDSWEFWKEEFEIIMNWKSGTKKITEETKQKMEETLEIDKK